MASFQQTGNKSTSSRDFQATGSSRSISVTSDDGSSGERPARSAHSGHSPWIQRLLSVQCQARRRHGRLRGPSWDLHRREEKISSTCAIRAWDVRGETVQGNNSPEIRTPDVRDVRRIQAISAGERNISFGVGRRDLSSRHGGKFSENALVSSGAVRVSENSREFRAREAAEPGDRCLESSQPVGSMSSQQFVESNSAESCSARSEWLVNLPSSSHSPAKVFEMEKSEMGKLEDYSVGAQRSRLGDDVLSSFEHMQRCSVGKGLHQEVQGAFPYAGIKNISWSTELSSFHDTCSTSSSALIKNLYCNNIGVSRPLVLESTSNANKTGIYAKYTDGENILHVNKYNSQALSGVKGIHKNGPVCKQLEIVDGNSGLIPVTPNLSKTANLWTSRFKENSLSNEVTQGGGNVDGPFQGSSQDVIVRSITKDKEVDEIHTYSTKEKQLTLSSFLWLQHWRCSNVSVTQRLMKTCMDRNEKCQSDSFLKGSVDNNASDASGSLKIVQEPVKDNSFERG